MRQGRGWRRGWWEGGALSGDLGDGVRGDGGEAARLLARHQLVRRRLQRAGRLPRARDRESAWEDACQRRGLRGARMRGDCGRGRGRREETGEQWQE
eukprot:3304869-Rhodomonas_salina.1